MVIIPKKLNKNCSIAVLFSIHLFPRCFFTFITFSIFYRKPIQWVCDKPPLFLSRSFVCSHLFFLVLTLVFFSLLLLRFSYPHVYGFKLHSYFACRLLLLKWYLLSPLKFSQNGKNPLSWSHLSSPFTNAVFHVTLSWSQ